MELSRRSIALAAFAALAVAIRPVAALARDRTDYEAARRAVQAGEIRPLTDILSAVSGKLPGELVGVELEQEGGEWQYEFRVINNKGRLFEVRVDARTGAIAGIKAK